jgi:histone deacetylase 11
VHTQEYLDSLRNSKTVAEITEVFFVAWFPSWLVQSKVLNPMLSATSGSILAAKFAIERGWAINLGGGFHHCCRYQGGGFCAFSDITLSYRIARENFQQIKKVMIIDLDAHQGNGHERDKLHFDDKDVYILDMYNKNIYPGDWMAMPAINTSVQLESHTSDKKYLDLLRASLLSAFLHFSPDIIYFNAGTDILIGDPLGQLDISPQGVIDRDEIVFRTALEKKIPVVMVLSGGYQRSNAKVIADSIINLRDSLLIFSSDTKNHRRQR